MNEDHCIIMCSPLGMYSILRVPYIISAMNDIGDLVEYKVEAIAKYIANMGSNAIRDFFWIDSERAYLLLTPFYYNNGKVEFREQYFHEQQSIARICNQHGLRYFLSLFDHCGTKKQVGLYNPWRDFSDYFYGGDAKSIRHEYIDRLLHAFIGLDVGFDICNEPRRGVSDFLSDTFLYLIDRGVDAHKIILGNDYFLKENDSAYEKDYRKFRESISRKLGEEWEQFLKSHCFSPVHNANLEHIEKMWGNDVEAGGTRNFLYSLDGVKPRPQRKEIYKITSKVLDIKRRAANRRRINFEIVLGKEATDPLDSLLGVVKAYKAFYGAYPKNYNRFPSAKFPVDPVEIDPPVTEPLTVEEQVRKLEIRITEIEKKLEEIK